MRRAEERVFVINKREVVTFVPAADEVPTGLAKGVDRLYLFEAQLHPQVRAALTAQVSLPARLTYGFRLLGSQTQVTWQLREAVVEEMDLTAAAAQYPIGPVQPEPILEVAWRVRSGQAGAPPTPADYEARAEKLLRGQRLRELPGRDGVRLRHRRHARRTHAAGLYTTGLDALALGPYVLAK